MKEPANNLPSGVELRGAITAEFPEILTTEALDLVAKLQRRFNGRRLECMERRQERQSTLDQSGTLDFLPERNRSGRRLDLRTDSA